MITVLAASYNGTAYIRQQMDSILAQSQDGILLVVSDDCSSDGTWELLQDYEKEHPGAVLALRRKKPSGGAARHFLELMQLFAQTAGGREQKPEGWEISALKQKRLREAAAAGYFMLSDQDDVWLPCKTEKLLLKMQQTEQERGIGIPVLVHSDLKVADERLRILAESFFSYQKISPERTALPQLLVQNNVTGGAVLFNRALLQLLERIPSECLMHDAWLALLASCFGAIAWVDEPLYLYRQHTANTLGAEKGDSLSGIGERLKDGSSARENYRKMFVQAGSLLELFPDRLTEAQRELLTVFSCMGRKSRIGKMAAVMRYGFTKNTWFRTLGELLFMGE